MKVYIDVNIIVDWATQREPFAKNATILMQLAKNHVFEAYTSPVGMANVFYLLRKEIGKSLTYELMKDCQTFMTFIDNSAQSLTQAIADPYRDFEDDLHFYSALENGITAFVTRNPKDFPPDKNIQILSPEALLYSLGY